MAHTISMAMNEQDAGYMHPNIMEVDETYIGGTSEMCDRIKSPVLKSGGPIMNVTEIIISHPFYGNAPHYLSVVRCNGLDVEEKGQNGSFHEDSLDSFVTPEVHRHKM